MKNNKMGLFSIILLGFNAIIGTGIFLLPNKAVALIGPASLLAILFDALLVISIAVCFAEMGGMYRANGGPYVYAKEAFGEFVGFEVGIMKWAISIIAWAAMAAGFSEALSGVLPVFLPYKTLITVSMIVVLSLVNLAGIEMSKTLNNIVTTGKLLPLIIFIAVGIFFIRPTNFTPFVVSTKETVQASFGAAALLIFYAFTGFESIAVAAEDMENPEKDVPKAIMLVILIVSIFYLLIVGISIGVLGMNVVNTTTPVQTAFEAMIGTPGKYLVAAGTLISIGGINIAASIMTPRSGSALANDGLIPRFIANKNKNGAPKYAILITALIAIPIALSGTFSTLAAISVVSRFAQYIPTALAVIVMRKKAPNMRRTFRVPFGPIIPVISVIVCIWLLTNSDIKKIIIGLGGLVIGAILYIIMKFLNKNDKLA